MKVDRKQARRLVETVLQTAWKQFSPPWDREVLTSLQGDKEFMEIVENAVMREMKSWDKRTPWPCPDCTRMCPGTDEWCRICSPEKFPRSKVFARGPV